MKYPKSAKTGLHRCVALLILAGLPFAAGCGPKTVRTNSVTALEAYVSEAKRIAQKESAAEGSLWMNSGRRSDLFRDPKARDLNDVVTISVIESTQASSVADAKNSKNTSAKAGIDKLFGIEKKIKELPTMTAATTEGAYEGKGSTSRTTMVRTSVTARVTDVLPNGYLVVEGMKDIRLNNENQSLHLRGVVRPEDINRDNVVLSSDVAQMTVRLQGKGVVSQPLNPGWLYKILTGILPF